MAPRHFRCWHFVDVRLRRTTTLRGHSITAHSTELSPRHLISAKSRRTDKIISCEASAHHWHCSAFGLARSR